MINMICRYCNKEINNNEKFCHHCGARVLENENKDVTYNDFIEQNQEIENARKNQVADSTKTMGTIAKVFMIISCIAMSIYIIPLLWTIPMTVSLSKKLKNNEPISVGFKICTFLFCNTISGILLLCMNSVDNNLNN